MTVLIQWLSKRRSLRWVPSAPGFPLTVHEGSGSRAPRRPTGYKVMRPLRPHGTTNRPASCPACRHRTAVDNAPRCPPRHHQPQPEKTRLTRQPTYKDEELCYCHVPEKNLLILRSAAQQRVSKDATMLVQRI